jgi:multiple sugar transport system permease protein
VTTNSGRSYRLGRVGKYIALYSTLCILAALFLLPYYIIVRNALSTRAEITGFAWVWFPDHPDWSNLLDLLTPHSPVLRGMLNSGIIAVVQTAAQLVVASTAGYGLARIPYRHATKVFLVLLATMMVPSVVTFIPTFAVVASLGWMNTLIGIIVPGVFSVLNLFMFRQAFLDFPKDLEEAGQLDGLGPWGVFLRIVMPNSVGITVALGTINFIWSWNAFLWPLVVGQNEATWTIQVAMSTFLNSYNLDLPGLFAASLLSVLPVLVLFFFLQRYIAQGVKMSGLKG